MDATLSKAQSVLSHEPTSDHPNRYIQYDEETNRVRRYVEFDSDLAEDLGYPDQVTISIEPGDRLNAVAGS